MKYTEDPADAPPGGFRDTYCYDYNTGKTTGFRSCGGTMFDGYMCSFTGWSGVSWAPDSVNLFVHERTTRTGVSRLVLVGRPRFQFDKLSICWMQLNVQNGRVLALNSDCIDLNMTNICGPGEIRILAGKPDPNDLSRFSIPFAARGRVGWIDGKFVEVTPPSCYPGEPIEPELGYVVQLSVCLATTQPTSP